MQLLCNQNKWVVFLLSQGTIEHKEILFTILSFLLTSKSPATNFAKSWSTTSHASIVLFMVAKKHIVKNEH